MQEGRWKLQYLYKTVLVWRWHWVCSTSNKFCDNVLRLDSLFTLKSPVHAVLCTIWYSGDGFTAGSRTSTIMLSLEGTVHPLPSLPQKGSPECHLLAAVPAQSSHHRLNVNRETAEVMENALVFVWVFHVILIAQLEC